MKEVRDLYATLENSYIEKYGDDENSRKYVKWLKNTYLDSLTKLTSGEIVEIEKPKIKTSFCFGYGFCGVSSQEQINEASDLAERARKSEKFFISEKLKQIDVQIKEAEDETRNGYLFGTGLDGFYTVGFMSEYKHSMYYGNKPHKVISADDRAGYIVALKKCKERFEKRLQTYLKRYGLSKIESWSYLCD